MQRGASSPFVVVVVALLFACGGSPTSPSANSDLMLRLGETQEAGDLRITFAEVVTDSRCPPDVVCVWAGDAEVVLRVRDGNRQGEVRLHTHGGSNFPRSATFAGYEFTLENLGLKPEYRGHFSVKVQTPSQSSGGGAA